jgi:hypothetical protein
VRPEEADVVRSFIYVFLGLVGLLLVAVAAPYLLIGHFNLASLASGHASSALGRQVTIDVSRITPGRWISVEVDAAQLATVPGGSRPMEVATNITFSRLDLSGFLRGGTGSGGGTSDADVPLNVARSPDPLIDAHLAARQLV